MTDSKSSTWELEEGKVLCLDFGKMAKAVEQNPEVIPVAIQNADTKEVILVAYTNRKAFERSVRTRIATFWSTVRNELLPELASLVDPSVPDPGPTLPSGHPFQNVETGGYWSATTHAVFNNLARVVSFYNGDVGNGDKLGYGYVWCVRGGQGADAQ